MRTLWGTVPVVAIEDLVEIKKTRPLADYEVISNLVRIRFGAEAAPSSALVAWAARNSFRAEDRVEYLKRSGRRPSLEATRRKIAREVAGLQARDVAYWSRHLEELRRWRRSGQLWPLGEPVKRVLATGKPRR